MKDKLSEAQIRVILGFMEEALKKGLRDFNPAEWDISEILDKPPTISYRDTFLRIVAVVEGPAEYKYDEDDPPIVFEDGQLGVEFQWSNGGMGGKEMAVLQLSGDTFELSNVVQTSWYMH